jgi:hypothetical protein
MIAIAIMTSMMLKPRWDDERWGVERWGDE